MILAIDVGNTHIVLGALNHKQLLGHWRLSTDRLRTADEYGVLLKEMFKLSGLEMSEVQAIIMASVVPPINITLETMAQKYFGLTILQVGPGIKTGISIKIESPRELGADRIVNAVAGYAQYGGPLIIVDFGTATTFCCINEKGEYLGGAIAPGIAISTEALFQRAAKLPRVEMIKPASVIGRNTISSMQSGIIFGFAGQVDAIVGKMQQELGGKAKVIATGGLASVMAEETHCIDKVDPILTLTGLQIIYERNQGH